MRMPRRTKSCRKKTKHGIFQSLSAGRTCWVCVAFIAIGVGLESHASAEQQEPSVITCWNSLDDGGLFGCSVAYLGDVDNDGNGDIAVGAYKDPTAGTERGSVWILFLNGTGTIKSGREITQGQNGFTGLLTDYSHFGINVAALGDLDGDGVEDLAVGENGSDRGGIDQGAVWILFLNSNGTVKSHQLISEVDGGFTGTLDWSDLFAAVGTVGDLDNDNVVDLAVGATQDDDGGTDRGAVWILFLNSNGTVKSQQKISSTQGGFTGTLDDDDRFGFGPTGLGDLDDDGVLDVAVGAPFDDDGGPDAGAVWVLFLNVNGTVKSHQKISDTDGGFGSPLVYQDNFGISLAAIDDQDGDGNAELAVGARGDDDAFPRINTGAVWILFLGNSGTIKNYSKISQTVGGFTGWLDQSDYFGRAVAWMGDHDGDGNGDLAVGSYTDDDGGPDRGAVWELFLTSSLSVAMHNKISDSYLSCTTQTVDHDTVWGAFNQRSFTVYNNQRFELNGTIESTCPDFKIDGYSGPRFISLGPNEWRKFYTFFEATHGGAFACSVITDLGCYVIDLKGYKVVGTGIGDRAPVFALRQNYPNPFASATRIEYSLDNNEKVLLAVYDVTGKRVRTLVDRRMAPGAYAEEWNGRDDQNRRLASGVYFYRLRTGSRVLTRKAVLLE